MRRAGADIFARGEQAQLGAIVWGIGKRYVGALGGGMKRLKQRVLTDEGDLRKGLSIVYARDDMGISSGKKR